MRLHEDKNAFRVLLEQIHEETGYRMDVLEKDYYVVLLLHELAQQQANGLQAYFKGGTALYKALKTTNRFSEDIDLSVDARECSRSQSDKRLERATKKYSSLPRDPAQGHTNRSEVIAVYTYEPIALYDANDSLQRFGRLKIEATSFTISEPTEELEISPMLYDLASVEQQRILRDTFNIVPFAVRTMTIERIFIDKLFAAEAYIRNADIDHRAFEAAKHIYDLSVMAGHPKIVKLCADIEQMEYLLNIRTCEEQERLDGIPGVMPKDFLLFDQANRNKAVIAAYETMQSQYVFRDTDRIPIDSAAATLGRIQESLMDNPAWTMCGVSYNTPDRRKTQKLRDAER